MADNLRLSLIIGAALGGGFNKAFRSAEDRVAAHPIDPHPIDQDRSRPDGISSTRARPAPSGAPPDPCRAKRRP